MNVLGIGTQQQSPKFNGAYARIEGKLVNLMGKTNDDEFENIIRKETTNKGGLSVIIKNAIDSKTRRKINDIELILTGHEKDLFRAKSTVHQAPGFYDLSDGNKLAVNYPYETVPQRSKLFIIDSLFGGKLKLFGNSSISEKEIAPIMSISKSKPNTFARSA